MRTRRLFLGLDIGTSGVKAAVTDADGAVAATGTASLTLSQPGPLMSEQSPDDWWDATEQAVSAIDPKIRAKTRGIGLAGQMHGATLLGADDEPLRPAILWNDGRSHLECAELEDAVPRSRKITGNLAMPGFTAPKLLWVRKHEPELFNQVRTVLLPKDYVRLRMTGEKASDMSDSAGTLWLDVAERRWSEDMLAACSLTTAQMPALHEGSEVTGTLRSEVAERWGMDQVSVVAGGGDNAAGAAGVGVVGDCNAFLSLGTSGVIFVATNDFRPNPAKAVHAFCHCLPNLWHQMAVHLSAASCIDWAAIQLGLDGPAAVFDLAEEAGAGTGPELFLPYLSGERTPHNDPHIRGAFLGLDNATSPGRLAAAVLEGVAFTFADGMAALREAGTSVERLTVIGGGSRSRHWGHIIAAAMGAQLDYIEGGEVGPALGAARLAKMGVDAADAATACQRPAVAHSISPDPALADRLEPKLEKFRSAYRALANA